LLDSNIQKVDTFHRRNLTAHIGWAAGTARYNKTQTCNMTNKNHRGTYVLFSIRLMTSNRTAWSRMCNADSMAV